MTETYAAEDKTMPAVCYALYLLGFATGGLTAVIGLVIAYAQQSSAGPAMRTHYTFLIRTFWLTIVWAVVAALAAGVLWIVGLPLTILLVGFALWALAAIVVSIPVIWFGVRCVVGLIYLSRGEAYPRPYAVLA